MFSLSIIVFVYFILFINFLHFFFFQLPENFNAIFKNDGNTYLKPQGEILIKNIFGRKIAAFNINEISVIFLPDNALPPS